MTSSLEKRKTPRRRVLKGAIIAYNDRRSTLPCTIRDLSSTGARVEAGVLTVPDTFLLEIELDGLEADCEVVHRRGMQLGVKFLSPPRKIPPKRSQIVNALTPSRKPSLRRTRKS